MENFGISSDQGWINRKFLEMRREIDSIRSARLELFLPTTSATANLVVDAVTGRLTRSTSSARYKQDITDLDLDMAAILRMRPRKWHDKRDVEDSGVEQAPWYAGFVAEELHDAGLGIFVGYNEQGEPESVNYDRLTVALLVACRVLVSRIGTQVERVAALEADVTAIRSSGTALNAKVTALNTKVTTLEQANTALTTEVTSLESQLTALTARVTTLETPPVTPPA